MLLVYPSHNGPCRAHTYYSFISSQPRLFCNTRTSASLHNIHATESAVILDQGESLDPKHCQRNAWLVSSPLFQVIRHSRTSTCRCLPEMRNIIDYQMNESLSGPVQVMTADISEFVAHATSPEPRIGRDRKLQRKPNTLGYSEIAR